MFLFAGCKAFTFTIFIVANKGVIIMNLTTPPPHPQTQSFSYSLRFNIQDIQVFRIKINVNIPYLIFSGVNIVALFK